MSNPDVKLDREILAKIHNEVKVLSNRMDYLETKIDYVIKGLVNHIDDHSQPKDHTKRNDLVRSISVAHQRMEASKGEDHEGWSKEKDRLLRDLDQMDGKDKTDLINHLERKVDYLMQIKKEEIDRAGYCINPTPRFK